MHRTSCSGIGQIGEEGRGPNEERGLRFVEERVMLMPALRLGAKRARRRAAIQRNERAEGWDRETAGGGDSP